MDAVIDGVDPDELVGSGGLPLRIEPATALQPGRGDAARLMVLWFVRKSFYWLFFVGLISASLGHEEVEVDWTSPTSVLDGLLSWLAPLILALIIRFASSWGALLLAYPLARAHEVNLSPRTSFGSSIGMWFDRLHVARAFRSLRWTHHVRQIALRRLGSTGERVGKLDPILDYVNIGSAVVMIVMITVVAASGG